MSFDAVIFDLDGTLLDSLEDIATAANEVLVGLGRTAHPLSDYRYLVGDGVAMLFQRALSESSDSTLIAECVQRFDTAYSKCWHNRSKPYDGIEQMLEVLNERSIVLSVLSNKPAAFTKVCVEYFFGNAKFAQVMGHSEHFPRKPDPSSAKWIAAQVGVCSDRIAYVGDTNTDMKTAVGAGQCAIGVTWGFRPESELVACGAQRICSTVHELTNYLLGSQPNCNN